MAIGSDNGGYSLVRGSSSSNNSNSEGNSPPIGTLSDYHLETDIGLEAPNSSATATTIAASSSHLIPLPESLASQKTSWRTFLLVATVGQLLSLCITSTNAINAKLNKDYKLSLPVTQALVSYALLAVTHIPYLAMQRGRWRQLVETWKTRQGLWYFVLGLADSQAMYLMVKAFKHTSMLSVLLIGSWTVPSVMLLSVKFLGAKYARMQIIGVAICLAGEMVLIASDVITGKTPSGTDGTTPANPLIGDILCILGATLLGASNVLEEYLLRGAGTSEVVGSMGVFGTIIGILQVLLLESGEIAQYSTMSFNAGLLVFLYGSLNCALGTAIPVVLNIAGATFFNLSLLTSNFYGLVVGVFVFGYSMYFLYPFAFIMVVAGMVIFHIYADTKDAADEYNDANDLLA